MHPQIYTFLFEVVSVIDFFVNFLYIRNVFYIFAKTRSLCSSQNTLAYVLLKPYNVLGRASNALRSLDSCCVTH